MRSVWCVLAAVALGAAAAPSVQADPVRVAAAKERPISGMITSADPQSRMIQVGPLSFHVPVGVYDFDKIEEGGRAVVHFKRTAEGRVVTSMEIDTRPR